MAKPIQKTKKPLITDFFPPASGPLEISPKERTTKKVKKQLLITDHLFRLPPPPILSTPAPKTGPTTRGPESEETPDSSQATSRFPIFNPYPRRKLSLDERTSIEEDSSTTEDSQSDLKGQKQIGTPVKGINVGGGKCPPKRRFQLDGKAESNPGTDTTDSITEDEQELDNDEVLTSCEKGSDKEIPPEGRKTNRTISFESNDSNLSASGLSGNDECGPMFAWQYWQLDTFANSIHGEGAIQAVLDTGIKFDLPVEGKLVDAINHVTGENPGDFFDKDLCLHGTKVATVAAGVHISGIQVHIPFGVAPKSSLVIFRIAQHKDAFDVDAIIMALRSVHDYNVDKNEMEKIRIIIMSFGLDDITPDNRSQIKTLIDYLKLQSVVCVTAAGNDGKNKNPKCPASLTNTLTVGSADKFGHPSRFSADHSCVDVLAPGENIVVGINENLTFITDSGTSYAAAAVAGLIACLLQFAKDYTRDGTALKHITDLDVLKVLFKKYMFGEQSKLLQPEKVRDFFVEQDIDTIVGEILRNV